MSKSRETWQRIKPLPVKEQFERIRLWDYVDGVHHCIDLSDNEVKLEPIDKIEQSCTLVDMEDSDLEELYNYQKDRRLKNGKIHSI